MAMVNMIKDVVIAKLRGGLISSLLRLAVLTGVAAGIYVCALIVAKGLTRGDEDRDDFGLVTIMAGKGFSIGAAPLSYGRVMTLLGSTRVDLSDAMLKSGGARLDLMTTLARVEVVVPADWAVEVEQISTGIRSGLDVELSDPDTLPDDAPRLSIVADTRWGCGSIVASATPDPGPSQD
jgi:hypothetical protein